jgi:hypothetical protein
VHFQQRRNRYGVMSYRSRSLGATLLDDALLRCRRHNLDELVLLLLIREVSVEVLRLETALIRQRPDLEKVNLLAARVSEGSCTSESFGTHLAWSLYSEWAIPVPPEVI